MKNHNVLHTSRVSAIILTIVFILTLCQPAVFAEDKIDVTVNGQLLKFDQPPIAENGRTLVPMRTIFESLNAIVEWDGEAQSVTAKKHSTEIKLTLGSNIAEINGEKHKLDVPAKAENGRTLVPARFVAEALKCDVKWNSDTNTVIIKNGKQIEDSKNLYDVDKVTYGKYNALAGQQWWNEVYDFSDFIEVSAGDTLYFTEYRFPVIVRYVTAYGADKNAIQELGKENVNQYTVPEGVKYIRVTTYAKNTAYLTVSKSNEPDGYIQDEICVATGRTITIYGNQLISKRTDGLNFSWECEIGSADGDNYVIDADAKTGEYPLKVTVTDKQGEKIWEGSSIIKIVKNEVKSMKMLAIGDSLTNSKSWISNIIERSGYNIEFVGTRKYVFKGNDGKWKTCYHEGRSGFSAGLYLSGSEYTFENLGVPDFFDGTRFNWDYYKKTTGVNPDAVQIFIGINGIANNPTVSVSDIKKMIDYIRLDDIDIPIFVVNTMYKGPLAADAEHTKVFNLTEKLNTELSGYENLYIVPVSIIHDSENNYAEKDQVHPLDQGYTQIADCIFSSLCANIK